MAVLQVMVKCPANASPGSQISVQTPAGMSQVVVPPGVKPGDYFRVSVLAVQPTVVQQQPTAIIQGEQYTQPSVARPLSELSTGSPVRNTGDDDCDGWCWKCICCPLYCPCCCCCCTQQVVFVHTAEVGIIERFGSYRRSVPEGEALLTTPCGNLCPQCNERMAHRISLRVRELPVRTTCKTKDSVFVTVAVMIVYRVPNIKAAFDAAYKLTSIKEQLRDYIEDILRSKIASVDLDHVFIVSNELAGAVREAASHRFQSFGYELLATLVTGIYPDSKVQASMNEIEAARRLRLAKMHQAEASKAVEVKRAEAAAEVKYLHGIGIARMRQAIVDGFRESVEDIDHFDISPTDLLLTTQYLDMLEHIGHEASANLSQAELQAGNCSTVLFLPVGMDALESIKQRLNEFLREMRSSHAPSSATQAPDIATDLLGIYGAH